MNPVEMRSRLRAVLNKTPDTLAPLWANEVLREHLCELVALRATPVSAISQISALTGVTLSREQYVSLRERALASPEYQVQVQTAAGMASPLVVASGTAAVTVTTTESAVSAEDPRVQRLLEHATERANGLQRMYVHQMAFIDGYIERGVPIPRERLHDMLKTADSAATAATTAARLIEMSTPQRTEVSEASLVGRAPVSLEELGDGSGRTVLVIEPEKKETKETHGNASVLPRWEPLLP